MDAIADDVLRRRRTIVHEPGRSAAVIGTEFCGLPRNGIVSAGVSHGSILGCCLKSVNHEQAVEQKDRRRSAVAHARVRLALTTNLLRSVLLQDVHRCVCSIGIGDDPHAEVAAAEARVVADRRRESRNVRQREHRETVERPPIKHHHLEAENGVRNPRRDRLAADDERPVVRTSRSESSSRTSRRPGRRSA